MKLPPGGRIIKRTTNYNDAAIREWTADDQVRDCCQEIPGGDPCVEEGKTEIWTGYPRGTGESTDRLDAKYKIRYGDKYLGRKIQLTGGPTSGPCGKKKIRWTGTLGCCDDPSPLVWGTKSSTVQRGKTYVFSASGGVEGSQFSGYSWSTVGAGLSISGSGLTARLTVDDCFCNPGLVIATDACGQQIITVVHLTGGSWSAIDDEYFESDYGWLQSGSGVENCTGGAVAIHGFNGNRTKHSTQLYGQVCYTKATESEDDETAIAGICAAGFAQPDYASSGAVSFPPNGDGYTKCDSGNVWYLDVSDLPSFGAVDFHAYYQNTSSITYEFTHTCQDNPLVFDYDNSADVIADYSIGSMVWAGGDPPFSVTVGGVEFYLDAGRTTNEVYNHPNRSIRVYAGDACGGGDITIKDSCGSSVSGKFRAADGRWILYQTAANNEGGLDYPDNGPYPPIPLPHATTVVMDGGMPAGGIYAEIGYWKGWNPIQTTNSVWNDTEAEAQANLDAVCAAGASGVYSPVVITDTITVHHFYVGTTGDYTSCGNGVYVHDDGITGPNLAGRWSFTYAVLWDFFAYSSSSVGLRVDKWVC